MEMERKMPINDNPDITLTIRLIMQGKEVGSIIGKKGEIVKRFREQSGAKINISDGSCPERIVTVTGTIGAIYKAFTLICKKVEEWCSQFQDNTSCNAGTGNVPRPPITLRLIVPASQCGSLIGKGGMKIKEIREVTGASIQVASEMLPNSTERAVTISGVGDSIIQCIYHICLVMIECPPKGATIPYRPKQQTQISGPVILAGGQAYTIQGNYAVPAHAADISALTKNPLAGLLGLSGLVPPPPPNTATAAAAAGLNPAALAALAGSQLRTNNHRHSQQNNSNSQQTTHHEMIVPNELIGCVIGKGGTKIAEIRQISGAMIRISNCDERENSGNSGGNGSFDRTITISGNPDAVNLAQYLINMSVELQKANLDPHQQDGNARNSNSGNGGSNVISTTSSSSSTTSSSSTSLANAAAAAAIPLAQLLLTKPSGILNNALSSLNALGSLTELLTASGVGGTGGSTIQTTGLHRSSHKAASNYGRSNEQGGGSNKLKDRNKFNPY